MRPRKSKAASGMSSPTLPACWSEPKCIPPTCKTATALRSSSPPFMISFPGCAISSPTAPMPAASCSICTANTASAQSRSCGVCPTPSVSRPCRAAGSSNAHWPGSIATAASPKTSRRQSPAPRLGSISPRSRSSLGDWHVPNSTYTILSRTLSRPIEYGSDGDFSDAFKEIEKSPDRVAAIVAAAIVEDALRWSLNSFLILQISEQEERELFENDGILSSFHAKILMGFALGLFGEAARNDLIKIKNIRNAFAHAPRPLSFDTPEIASECEKLRYIDATTRNPDRTIMCWKPLVG